MGDCREGAWLIAFDSCHQLRSRQQQRHNNHMPYIWGRKSATPLLKSEHLSGMRLHVGPDAVAETQLLLAPCYAPRRNSLTLLLTLSVKQRTDLGRARTWRGEGIGPHLSRECRRQEIVFGAHVAVPGSVAVRGAQQHRHRAPPAPQCLPSILLARAELPGKCVFHPSPPAPPPSHVDSRP